MKKTPKKTVVFEEVSCRDRLLIRFYAARGTDVLYLRVSDDTADKTWFREYCRKGLIVHDDTETGLYAVRGRNYSKAFDVIEEYSRSHIEGNATVKAIEELYMSKEVLLAFKKRINERLSRFFYLREVSSRLAERYSGRIVFLIPARGVKFYRTYGQEIFMYRYFHRTVGKLAGSSGRAYPRFTLFSLIVSGMRYFSAKAALLGKYTLFSVWMTARWILSLTVKNSGKMSYKYAVAIICPVRQFANNIRKIDFLVDGSSIKKSETVFISSIKLDAAHEAYFRANGLNYVNIKSHFYPMPSRVFFDCTKALFRVCAGFFSHDNTALETALIALYYRSLWGSVLGAVELSNFITHVDIEPQSILRNILLRRNGVKTWYYIDSQNFAVSMTKSHFMDYRFNDFGFLNHDYFISWNMSLIEYFKASHTAFREHYDVGCLWAQHIREINEGKIKSRAREALLASGCGEGMKVVAVFDSTYHSSNVTPKITTTYECGMRFLSDIERLLEETDKIFIVFKEKKIREKIEDRCPEMARKMEKLDGHTRFLSIGANTDVAEVVAVSDLVISFPFSSPTFEALSAGKRGIWHDPLGVFGDSPYAEIEDLVSSGYEELKSITKSLLWEISDSVYKVYLREKIRGKVESFLDGRAIDRFRDLLSNVK
ncbi:MAG: polysaccharide biosynthesis PFTS motif protein [Candidatus Omnitrophica bacterium]|nr:polysaccharide biosynthesis PFTS motif protein [Candidatus Omnitrophota bacterium]